MSGGHAAGSDYADAPAIRRMLNACNVASEVQASIFGGTLWRVLSE